MVGGGWFPEWNLTVWHVICLAAPERPGVGEGCPAAPDRTRLFACPTTPDRSRRIGYGPLTSENVQVEL
jgi:hypothetical protein